MLAYRLPREPSTPRSALWRKLRRLGAAQLVDGLVALPLDARNREQLEWIADEVLQADGEATVWLAQPAAAADHRALEERLRAAIAEEYRELITRAQEAASGSDGRRRALTKLRREQQRIRRRDYFPPPEREAAQLAINDLAATVEQVAS